jgi:hypothetical protein
MGETRKPIEKPSMKKREKETNKPPQHQGNQEPESPSYRLALKNIFNCKSHLDSSENHRKRCKKSGCSGSLCKQKETSLCKPEEEPCERRRASISACTSKERLITKKPLNEMVNGEHVPGSFSTASCASSNSYSSIGGSFKGMQFRRLSGCYECHSVVDPVHGGSMRVMCTCHDCGEIFVRNESLEHHQAIRHAGNFLVILDIFEIFLSF